MRIKTKLRLGTGLLFGLITLLAIIGARQINILASDSQNVLVSNYNSMDYSRMMLEAVDDLPTDKQARITFEQNLKKQTENITEQGEKELTEQLRQHYNQLFTDNADTSVLKKIRTDIYNIISLNMNAINRKSGIAESTAKSSVTWIVVTGTFCFLIALTLFINLPGNIANPIRELTASIKQIAKENYAERVHFGSNDEFGELAISFNTMAEKLEEYNSSNLANLMIEKKRVETLISNMHDPVIGLNEDKIVIFANEEALKITALKAENLVGLPAAEVAMNNDLLRMLIKDTFGEPAEKTETPPLKIFADGKESYFEKENVDISIVPTGEMKSRSIGHVIILRNITPYKELDFAKTNFIASVSHELKTPLSSIKISLDLLKNEKIGNLNTEQCGLVESIKDDAERLLKITGELLNITQVESGKVQLSITSSPIDEIIGYAVKANEMQAENKQIKCKISSYDPALMVVADLEKTAWVLTNLVSNAIRYSYENAQILIDVSQNGEEVRLSVKDNGPGIAQEYREKVFTRYFRIPGSSREGTGLGLAISREFIEAQGGKLSLSSELGAGSTFTVILKAA